ncbi:MAG: Rieske (2Fe-2S) protein [Gemmataceae bacterium]
MAEFQTVCRVGELSEGQGKTISLNGKIIALFLHEGQYYAIDDMCPHMGAPLSDGYVEAGTVTCNWHAWRFRLADGAWADNPRLKIGSYPVRIVGDEIQLKLEKQ